MNGAEVIVCRDTSPLSINWTNLKYGIAACAGMEIGPKVELRGERRERRQVKRVFSAIKYRSHPIYFIAYSIVQFFICRPEFCLKLFCHS